MFRHAVGREDDGEALVRRSGQFVHVALDDHGARVVQLLGERVFLDRGFHRFVVLGERPFHATGAEQLAVAFLVHDEGIPALARGQRRPAAVGHVADPFGSVPADDGLGRVPGLAVQVHRSPVVQDAAVDGPAPGVVRVQADVGLLRRLGPVASLGFVDLLAEFFLGVAAGVQPVQAESGAVVAQGSEARDLLPLLVFLALDHGVFGEPAVALLSDAFRVKDLGEVHLQQRIRIGAAFLDVQFLDLVGDSHGHGAQGHAFTLGLGGLVVPQLPAAGVGDAAFFFHAVGRGEQEAFGLDLLGIHARAVPEVRGLGVMHFSEARPVQVGHGLADLVGVRDALGRVGAPHEAALDLVLVHAIEDVHVRIVGARIGLRQPAVAETVLLGAVLAVPGLEQAGHVGGLVLPPVGALRVVAHGRIGLGVLLEGRPVGLGHGQVAGQDVPQDAVVRGALDVGLAAQGLDAAAGHADVAEHELDQGAAADVLHADGVLGPAQGVADGAGLVRLAGSREVFPDFQQIFLGYAGDGTDFVQRVSGIMLLHELEHAARILEGLVAQGHLIGVGLECPRGLVVRLARRIVAREHAILEGELVFHDKSGVGVLGHVLLEVLLILDDVVHQTAQEGQVGTGAQRHMIIAAC